MHTNVKRLHSNKFCTVQPTNIHTLATTPAMVTKSWAQVAALPGGKAKRPVQTPTLEPSEAVDSGRSIDDAGLVRQSESPGIKVTGAQPKANTDGAHLVRILSHIYPSSSPSQMRLHIPTVCILFHPSP